MNDNAARGVDEGDEPDDSKVRVPRQYLTSSSLPRGAYYLLAGLVALMAGVYTWRYMDGNRPERRFERAVLAAAEGDFETVERELKAMGDAPSFAAHRNLLDGALKSKRKQHRAALVELAKIPADSELYVEALKYRSRCAYDLGLWNDAEEYLREAVRRDPDDLEAGEMLREMRTNPPPGVRFQRALAAYRNRDDKTLAAELDALRNEPEYQLHCRFLDGVMLVRRNMYPMAMQAFEETAKHPQLRAPTLVATGESLYMMGRAAEAERLWQQVVAENQHDADAHRWLGVLYYDLGSMDLAVHHLSRVNELDSRDPRPSRLMGLINKDYEHFEDAAKHYRETLHRGMTGMAANEVKLELAECLLESRKNEEALEALTDVPDSAAVKIIRAEVRLNQGDADTAQSLLDEAAKDAPDDLRLLRLQAAIQMEKGNPQDALAPLERACELFPMDYFARFRLSQALQRTGNADRAKAELAAAEDLKTTRLEFSRLHEVASREPTNADVRFRIGLYAHKLQRDDLAVGWFRAALAIDPQRADAAAALRALVEGTEFPEFELNSGVIVTPGAKPDGSGGESTSSLEEKSPPDESEKPAGESNPESNSATDPPTPNDPAAASTVVPSADGNARP